MRSSLPVGVSALVKDSAVNKRLFALAFTLTVAGITPAHAQTAAAPNRPDDGGLHVRVLPMMAGALGGGFVAVVVTQILFPAMAPVAGISPLLQPAVMARALTGIGIGAFLGERYFP